MTTLIINGKTVTVNAEPDTPLLWVLRGELKLVGTKFGCGKALCGACTVHLNGDAVRACVTPIEAVQGREVTTIEGVKGGEIDALRRAWTEIDVVQCGYCQSGQLVSACALLKKTPRPSNRCECRDERQHLPPRHLPPHPGSHPTDCCGCGIAAGIVRSGSRRGLLTENPADQRKGFRIRT